MRPPLRLMAGSFLVFGLLGCVEHRPAREASNARPPSEGMIDVNGVRLHYLEWAGAGDLILFLPGLGDTAYEWLGVAPRLAGRYHVVALTPREHGTSDKPGPPFSLEAFADDAAAVISRFSDRPAIVVGHSFAGWTMIPLALRHPSRVAALVFLDALSDITANTAPRPALPGFSEADTIFPSIAAAAESYLNSGPPIAPELLEPFVRSRYRETADGRFTLQLSPATENQLRQFRLGASKQDPSGITVPVLAVRIRQGEALAAFLVSKGMPPESVAVAVRWAKEWDDPWKTSKVDQVVKAIPGARAIVLDSVTHSLPLEHPDKVVDILNDFLGSLPSPRS